MLVCPLCKSTMGPLHTIPNCLVCHCEKFQAWTKGGPMEWTFRPHYGKVLWRIGDRVFVRAFPLFEDEDVLPEDSRAVYEECLDEAMVRLVFES